MIGPAWIGNGWLNRTRRMASPNYDARPAGVAVDTLVIHGISLPPGRFGHGCIDALFTNTLDVRAHPFFAGLDDLRVSAHVLIARAGTLTQYVGFDERAWHAGASFFDGRPRVNDFAVGVELEGTDDCPYTPAQYRMLAALARILIRYYPKLTHARIVGHSDIALGRKTDPGPAFDWRLFDRYLLDSPRW
jgi:AmpD protein